MSKNATMLNAPSVDITTYVSLPPARCTMRVKMAHRKMDTSPAHLGGGCGSSLVIVAVIVKYSFAARYDAAHIHSAQTSPPDSVTYMPKTARMSADMMRVCSLAPLTLGVTRVAPGAALLSSPPSTAPAAASRRCPPDRDRFLMPARRGSGAPPRPFPPLPPATPPLRPSAIHTPAAPIKSPPAQSRPPPSPASPRQPTP
mmetsp:Transcript_32098/g.80744  ORF Transcript_32098/g.80744 Transcript_32098/m.80744 type:complete len:200 (+) Transcript_32098:702-1301(+)